MARGNNVKNNEGERWKDNGKMYKRYEVTKRSLMSARERGDNGINKAYEKDKNCKSKNSILFHSD